ncbi:JAB domain-containing protein [Enterococcus raffinosus]|uniref:JAB domain-containing protein n=1 Tax=Enterococcus raffinosus TaxID=71452 RepID=UPI001C1202B0|nr:JAB domain-containing protein [Enterococcus raffinosus]MBU5363432.1 JAB domain-containing protein [Enterococcus raffinosus]
MKKNEPRKRVNVVSLQLVKESSLLYGPRRITSTRLAYELFEPYLKEKDREHLYVVGLNTKKEPTFLNLTSIGTINQAIAVPRDILKPAILANSTSIIVAHCHPSGDTNASLQDIQFTKNLIQACKTVQIQLVDHLIIGCATDKYSSLREQGHINDEE